MSVTNNNTDGLGPYNDLGEHQYSILYKSMDVPLIDIRKKYYYRFVILSLLLLLIAFLLAFLVKIPNYLQLPIVMENAVQDHVKIFNHSTRVKQYFVNLGDTIKEGQPICQISSPEIQNLISAINTAKNNIKALEGYDSKNVNIQIVNIDKQAQEKKRSLEALHGEEEITISLFNSRKLALKSNIAYAKTIRDKNKVLHEHGAVSQEFFLEREKEYSDLQNELSILKNLHLQSIQQFKYKVQEIKEALIAYSITQDELEINYESDKNKLEDQIKLAKDNLQLFYGAYKLDENKIILLAPKDGRITYRYPDNELIETGDIIYRLEEYRGEFESKGLIESKNIGYLKTKMKAKIMLETFPHYEWGSISGHVAKISASPNRNGQYTFSIALDEKNYKISPLLQNGHTGQASIIIEKKSLVGYIFRNFKKELSRLVI